MTTLDLTVHLEHRFADRRERRATTMSSGTTRDALWGETLRTHVEGAGRPDHDLPDHRFMD